jgi:protease-4
VKTFFLALAGAFTALLLFVLLMIMVIGGLISSASAPAERPQTVLLTLDLRQQWPDNPSSSGLSVFEGDAAGFTDILLSLNAAAKDPAVKGLFIRASDLGIGSSRAEELRDVILQMKAEGKFVIAHTQGSLFAGPSLYRSVSAASELWLQPGSDFSVPGISFESLFLGDAMAQFSVVPEFVQLYEYKNAVDTFTTNGFTDAHRQSMKALADSLWTVSLRDIAQDRGIASAEELGTQLSRSPLSDAQALEARLVDKLGYPEDAYDAALEKAGGDEAVALDVASYAPPPAKAGSEPPPAIALIGAEGDVITGSGEAGPFGSAASFASDTLAAAIIEAGRDERVKALVLRIDSGGGSPVASEQIWRAIERVKADGKPVVVSMGAVAASGAYYVSAPADFIFASETTITGSIGVFGGKFAVDGGMGRLGVRFDQVSAGGAFADAFGSDRFTPEQFAAFETALVRTYDRFITVVATGRKLDEAKVREIAKGRVWTGAEALPIGLIDAHGGLIEAIAKAGELAEIPEGTQARILRYPEPGDPFEELLSLVGAQAEGAATLGEIQAALADPQVRALLAEVARARAIQNGGVQARGPMLIER